MTTGFLYKENGFFANFSFYGLLIITFGAIIALCVLDKKRGGSYFSAEISGSLENTRSVAVGFPMLVAGAIAIYEGYLQATSMTPSGFYVFVDFLFGAAIAVLGLVILIKGRVGNALGFCMVIPAIYYALRGICVFIDRMAINSIPEYLIECMTIIGFGVFFMLLAKLLSGNEGKHTRTAVSAVGITTAVMTLSSAVATIVADIADPLGVSARIVSTAAAAELERQKVLSYPVIVANGNYYSMKDGGYFMSYTSWVDVVLAIGVILVLAVLYTEGKKAAAKAAEPVEEPDTASETQAEE